MAAIGSSIWGVSAVGASRTASSATAAPSVGFTPSACSSRPRRRGGSFTAFSWSPQPDQSIVFIR
jgi:hypothetical protein